MCEPILVKYIINTLKTTFVDNNKKQFVGTNESPTVIYEKMVEGVYTFVLKVWTNTNEYRY